MRYLTTNFIFDRVFFIFSIVIYNFFWIFKNSFFRRFFSFFLLIPFHLIQIFFIFLLRQRLFHCFCFADIARINHYTLNMLLPFYSSFFLLLSVITLEMFSAGPFRNLKLLFSFERISPLYALPFKYKVFLFLRY